MGRDFADDIEWFMDHVGSIRRMLPPFAHATSIFARNVQKDFDKFLEHHAKDTQVDDHGRLREYAIPSEVIGRHRVLRRSLDDGHIFTRLLPQMSLVMLVSVYDAYLGRLLRGLLRTKREIMNSSKRLLTYAQLADFSSIDDARDHVLESEVEAILRDSHTAQFKWLENKLGISLRKDLPSWPCFIELTERRNLFVHADGVVGAQYLNVCRQHGAAPGQDASLGTKLEVRPDYFRDACDCISEIGVKLGQVIWRKIKPNDLNAADESLNSVCYDLLVLHEYPLAEVFLAFATMTLQRRASTENTLMFKINLAIAYKWRKKTQECAKLLDEIEWSALADKFQIAAAVLRDDYDLACQIMKRLGRESLPNSADYRDWPLFREFRKSDHFKQTFREVFGVPFRLVHSSSELAEEPEPSEPSGAVEPKKD